MRGCKYILFILALLVSASMRGQYNPTNPTEPGVPTNRYTLTLQATPSNAGSFNVSSGTSYTVGTNISLRAYTNTNFTFSGWELDGEVVSTSSSFTYTMPAKNVKLVAHYKYNPSNPSEPPQPVSPPKYSTLQLAASPSAAGYFNISSNNSYVVGTSVSLRAYNNSNFVFTNWTENGEIISTSSSFVYVMKEGNPKLVANYTYVPSNPSEPSVPRLYHRLTLGCNPSGGGYFNVSSGNEYQEGTSVHLQAYSNQWYTFLNWTQDGEVISTSSSFYYAMPTSDVTLIANYSYNYSYDPSQPSEPGKPAEGNHIYGMTENAVRGQTITYPVYLENSSIVSGMVVDLQFPTGFAVDINDVRLAGRAAGHELEVGALGNNAYRFSLLGDESFDGYNGKMFDLLVTIPDTASMGHNYPVILTHGVIHGTDGTQTPIAVRSGYIYVEKIIEDGLYARFSYDKLQGRVKFTNLSSGNATSYLWDFGDGSTSTEKSPLHIYAKSGYYTVTLTTKGEVDTDVAQMEVLVNDESSWKVEGTFYLSDEVSGVRHFTSVESLLKFINASPISGNIKILVKGNQTFNYPLTSGNKQIWNNILSSLESYSFTLTFNKWGAGRNPIVGFGQDGESIDADLIKNIVDKGHLFLCEGVDLRWWGIAFNPAKIYELQNQKIHSGQISEAIDLSPISTELNFIWTIAEKPQGVSGYKLSGERTIPAMTIVNEGEGDCNLTYNIKGVYNGTSFCEFTNVITVTPALVGLFSNLSPANGTVSESTKVTLNWNRITNAVYDVYLWNAANQPSKDPVVSGTTDLQYVSQNFCQNGNTYKWLIVARNEIQELTSDTMTFSIRSLPDLHVYAVDCSEAVAGEKFTVQWTVKNDGVGSTGQTRWNDYVWLVTDVYGGTISSTDGFSTNKPQLLATVQNVKSLEQGESYQNSVDITLEERVYGNYYILVTADMYSVTDIDWSKIGGAVVNPYNPSADGSTYNHLYASTSASYNKLSERGEKANYSDNFFYKKIEIAVPHLADLQVPEITSFVIPTEEPVLGAAAAATRATAVERSSSGEPLITWQESYVPSPITAAGLRKSNSYYSGKKIAVKVTVANKGGENSEKPFRTVLYMSSSPDRDAAPLTTLGTISCKGNIPPGESKTYTFTHYMPYEWFGETYYHAYADIDDAVYELANTVNNWGVGEKVDFLLCPGADFVPTQLAVPSVVSSSSSFDISYKVANKGAGIPYNSAWRDEIYISKKSTGLDGSATLLTTVSQGGGFSKTIMGNPGGPVLLKPEEYKYEGDNYTKNIVIKPGTLPSGIYYLYAKVDASDLVYEHQGEDNNVICSEPIRFVLPDLSSELVSVSADTLSTGQTVALTWKLKNVGTGDIQNAKIKDSFYTGINQDGSAGQLLTTVENTVWIAAGEEKTLRTNITIPKDANLNGLRYMFLKTNVGNTLLEENSANNLSLVKKVWFKYESEPVVVVPTVRGANLYADKLNMPAAAKAGKQVSLTYTLLNNGDVDLADKEVSQEVYLSSNYSFSLSNATKCIVTSQKGSSKSLKAGYSVTITLTFDVPTDIVGGHKYVHVFADRENVLGEKRTDDNYLRGSINIEGNLADLTVTDFVLPDTLMTSENVTLKFTTKNIGEWDAVQSTTRVYLSADKSFNSNDTELSTQSVAAIKKGATVTNTATLNIADRNVGSWYILLRTDANANNSELDEGNNVTAIPVTVLQSPLPDLTVNKLSTDEVLTSGQTMKIKTTIANIGKHATRSNKWSDTYYLSPGTVLNTQTATKLGSKTHVGSLAVNGTYDSEVSFTVPTTLQGNFMLFIVTDAAGAIIEENENNNSKCVSVYVNGSADTPADLVISGITAPSMITAGDDVAISYQLSNVGDFTANGTINDVIYFSKDNQWDMDDEMVGVVSGKLTIHPGNSVTRTVKGRVTNMPEGDYYIIVKTNSTKTIAEKSDANNTAVSTTPSTLNFKSITLGSSASVSTSGYYKLEVPVGSEGMTVGFYLDHPEESSVGLYAAYERVPSTAKYDFASSALIKTQQEVLIPNVKAGKYYILAQDNAALINATGNVFSESGSSSSSVTPMTISVEQVFFGATTLSITEGGAGGWVSTDVNGALFDSIMDFRLKMAEKVIPAEAVTYNGMTQSRVTFNLNDAEVGTYDVVSELPDGTQATLPKGFKVIPGTSVGLGAKIDAPSIVRIGSYAPISVSYANGGNTDIEIYRLMLVLDNGYLGTSIQDLERHQSVLYIDLGHEGNSRGYTSIPPGEQRTINLFMYQTTNTSSLTIYVVK